MERRILLAIVLSFLVLVLYQIIFIKKEAPTPEEKQELTPQLSEKKGEEQALEQESLLIPSQEEVSKEYPLIKEDEEREIIIETSLYKAIWSNKGAVLKSLVLKKHKDDEGNELEIVSQLSKEIEKYPFSLKTQDPLFDALANNSLYFCSESSVKLNKGEKKEISFKFSDEKGNSLEKILIFQDGKYEFQVEINLFKMSQRIEPFLLWGPSLRDPSPKEQKQRFGGGRGIAILSADKIYRLDEKKFKAERSAFNFVIWAAYEDNYFTALFLTSSEKSSALFFKEQRDNKAYFFLAFDYPQKVFIGPKDFEALKGFGFGANKLIKFGFFGFIAELLLHALKFIHRALPNWGVSIIILTLVIKILFFPLTYTSTRSMAKMQELQPKIKAIRAKYKKAKQDIALRRKMNEEMMKLYKEHGINPAGGCLPLLIQIPIFWGFFRLLVVAVELRHSPFIFWIDDLSVKDPYYVTPILMGITQFISQKMTPTSADPAQARMMLIMPFVMTIFFMNFQSGLVLYWLTNNVLQIVQQYLMNRLMKRKKREAHGKRNKK